MLYIAIVNFNSIKVQLEREAAQGIALLCHYFNSIKVQLEPWVVRDYLQKRDYFNSIKVQLERFATTEIGSQ